MSARAEQFFQELRSVSAVKGLIGQCEDAHFDCKEWPSKDDDAQKMIAKAACGLTNAEGGILVIGMKAESKPKDEPDVVSSAAPVADTALVKSRILNLIGGLVEPGIVGIDALELNDPPGAKSGFVLVYVPASEGSPRRSRKDWKFYQRIGSGTFPMEYFQIEDLFGRRPRPRLELSLEFLRQERQGYDHSFCRTFRMGIVNVGRSLARFPSIRFRRGCGLVPSDFGLDGNGNFGLPRRASESDWFVFGGGADEVIYPGALLPITLVVQKGKARGRVYSFMNKEDIANQGLNEQDTQWDFGAIEFSCEISCEATLTETISKSFPAATSFEPSR